MNKKIIALVGNIGTGKSTVAEYLAEKYNGSVVSFADPIRNMFKGLGLDVKNMSRTEKELPSDKLSGRTVRHAMQTLGTEWARKMMAETFWVDRWADKVKELQFTRSCEIIVTDDCRFLNEASAVRGVRGTLIRINRDTDRSGIAAKHISEIEMDLIKTDFTIDNNKHIAETYQQLEEIMRKI